MKKLLILMLVLGMASTANALMLEYKNAAGGNDVLEGSVVTINIRGDVACTSFRISTAITGDFSGVTLGTVDSGFDFLNIPGQLKDGSVGNLWIFQTNGAVDQAGGSPAVLPSVVFATFTLTAGTAGNTITFDDWAGVLPPPTDTNYNGSVINLDPPLVLNIIPEPATLALLGLGGLFLVRRRK